MHTEKDILKDLKGENNMAFGRLYKIHFRMVSRFITDNKGTISDAEDIFQDTMIVLVEKLRQDNFRLSASLKTYVMAIAKNQWLKKIRTSQRSPKFTELTDSSFFEEITDAIDEGKTYWDKLHNYIDRVTNHCMGLIQDVFFNNKPIEQIQQEYGYTTRHNAINQKHKCIEQIRREKEKEEKLRE
jgi:RNA polymerase sigma factor (sigma-70 family)